MLKLKAYTFIELLLSLAIVSLLLFFAIPFNSSIHQKNQCLVIENDVKQAISYAKTQAWIRGQNLILRPKYMDDWSHGMILFIDNATHKYHNTAPIIHEWSWNFANIVIDWHGFQSRDYLVFYADSRKNVLNGTFNITSHNARVRLVINKMGRVKQLK